MFTTLARLNSLSAIISSSLFVLIGMISLTSLRYPESTLSNIQLTQFNVVNGYNKLNEFAFLRFDGLIDSSHLFDNWNTKQVFVQLTANYNNKNTQSSTVVWDKIIKPHQQHTRIENAKQKYSLKSKSFKDYTNATLTLTYDIQPYVGLNRQGVLHSQPIEFPNVKSNI